MTELQKSTECDLLSGFVEQRQNKTDVNDSSVRVYIMNTVFSPQSFVNM